MRHALDGTPLTSTQDLDAAAFALTASRPMRRVSVPEPAMNVMLSGLPRDRGGRACRDSFSGSAMVGRRYRLTRATGYVPFAAPA